MTTHDPKQVIEDFRNQLARHDRTLVFLFGAGTSSAINIAPEPDDGNKREYIPLIPGIDGLTEACRTAVESMGESHPAAWQMLIEQCDQAGQPANVENLLSRVRMKIEAMGEEEKLVGLDRNQLRSVERTISATIAKTVNPSDDSIPRHTPHGDFAAWVKKVNRTSPLEICTTNYDILLERALEFARVPIFDGFVGTNDPFFYPECLDDEKQLPESNWVRLWKLHGSVNWHVQELPDGKRFIRGVPSESGELILPSLWKYTESRKQPYVAYMDRLSRLMNSEHALLITSGYSFGDEHINEILFAALDNGETRNVVALLYHDLDESDDIIKEALQRSNLLVIGPNGGVISGTWGLWQLTQSVDKKTHSFMDTAFDSNASPESAGSSTAVSADLKGKMRLGNFNWFCRFLNEMIPNSQ